MASPHWDSLSKILPMCLLNIPSLMKPFVFKDIKKLLKGEIKSIFLPIWENYSLWISTESSKLKAIYDSVELRVEELRVDLVDSC